MKVPLLLTDEFLATKPSTTKIVEDFGKTEIFFESITDSVIGKACIVEDTQENIINWLKEFEFVYYGVNIYHDIYKKMTIKPELI